MRKPITARGCGALLFECGRYKARRTSFGAERWQIFFSVNHFFKKIGDSYVKERSKKIYFQIYFSCEYRTQLEARFFFAVSQNSISGRFFSYLPPNIQTQKPNSNVNQNFSYIFYYFHDYFIFSKYNIFFFVL